MFVYHVWTAFFEYKGTLNAKDDAEALKKAKRYKRIPAPIVQKED